MPPAIKNIIWNQFGASIDALENSVNACPGNLWFNRNTKHEFWYMTFHTLFWLDYYLTIDRASYTPPEPFTLSELDPAGVIPDRPYTKEELLTYLEHGRTKCRTTIRELTESDAFHPFKFGKVEMNFAELLLYNLRHVQHHTAQLNLLLRQNIDSAPRWTFQAKTGLDS